MIESISFIVVNIVQICLGAAGLASTAIITASRQLEFEKKALEHLEHAGKYSETHRSIRAELVLLRMNDSAYASNTDFMKAIQHEIDRVEELAPSITSFFFSLRLWRSATCHQHIRPVHRLFIYSKF